MYTQIIGSLKPTVSEIDCVKIEGIFTQHCSEIKSNNEIQYSLERNFECSISQNIKQNSDFSILARIKTPIESGHVNFKLIAFIGVSESWIDIITWISDNVHNSYKEHGILTTNRNALIKIDYLQHKNNYVLLLKNHQKSLNFKLILESNLKIF